MSRLYVLQVLSAAYNSKLSFYKFTLYPGVDPGLSKGWGGGGLSGKGHHGCDFSRGDWGHALPEIFENLSL